MKKNKTNNFDVVISGSGLNGTILAVALATQLENNNLIKNIAIVENNPQNYLNFADKNKNVPIDHRCYALSPASVAFLEKLGVWQNIDEKEICIGENMEIFGDANGYLKFAAADQNKKFLCHFVEADVLKREMAATIKHNHKIQVLCPKKINNFSWKNDDSLTINLDDNEEIHTKLLVAAEGKYSQIREMSGLSWTKKDYQEQALLWRVKAEHFHRNTAFQWFYLHSTFAFLPMPNNELYVIWFSKFPERFDAEYYLKNPQELAKKAEELSQNILGKMTLCPEIEPIMFPIELWRANEIIAPRLAIIGDSAHGIHPLTGQGLNLGIADIRAMTKVFSAAKENDDIGDLTLLKQFARKAKAETIVSQCLTDFTHDVFQPQFSLSAASQSASIFVKEIFPFLQPLDVPEKLQKLEQNPAFNAFINPVLQKSLPFLRNSLLSVVNKIPPVKNILMQNAQGIFFGNN